MIRNWIEIATHSKMNLINDDWLSYRDLHNKEYIDKIAKQGGSKAGWLRFEDNEWRLYSADLWFVKSKDINDLYGKKVIQEKSTALDAYQRLNGIKQIFFTEELTDKKRKATLISKDKKNSPNEGWLIFTGQIQSLDDTNKFAKKHHYVFSDPKDKDKLNLNTNVLAAFLQMVDKDKDKNLFQYFKKQQHKNGIPVFYLTEKNAVAHIGFSKMLRLTYKHPVKELKYDSHNEKTSKLDFSELLFGSINDNQKLKGRVNFSLATCQTNSEPYALPPTVLGSPKNSFYPAYIDQTSAKGQYNTYNQNKAKLAGFKRYGVHLNFDESKLPSSVHNGKTNEKTAIRLFPLPENQMFTGKIRFHNLKPQELGAILKSITSTKEQNLFHLLGMGKALGLGKIKFKNIQLTLNPQTEVKIADLEQSFENYVETKIQSKDTLNKLLAMQNEHAISDNDLAYLNFPKGFTEVKKTKGEETLKTFGEILKDTEKQQSQLLKKNKREEKLLKKEQALQNATEEEKIFINLQQMLSESKNNLTDSLKKNIAKEINNLHGLFMGKNGATATEQKIFAELLKKAEDLSVSKIDAAIKKIKRDILNH